VEPIRVIIEKGMRKKGVLPLLEDLALRNTGKTRRRQGGREGGGEGEWVPDPADEIKSR